MYNKGVLDFVKYKLKRDRMTSFLEEAKLALGVDNDFAISRIIEEIVKEKRNPKIISECYLILTPLLCDQKETRIVMSSFMNLFNAHHNKIVKTEEIKDLFEKIETSKNLKEFSPTWLRVKVCESMFYFFEFNDLEKAKLISSKIRKNLEKPPSNKEGDEKDMFRCFSSVSLGIADIEDNDEEIEKNSCFLFPSVFPFNERILEVYDYGSALFCFRKRKYRRAASVFLKLLHSITNERRREKCLKYGILSNLIIDGEFDYKEYIEENAFMKTVYDSLMNDKEIPSLPDDEKDELFKSVFNTFVEKTNEKRLKDKVGAALKAYSRVSIKYVSNESGIPEETIIKYSYYAGYLIEDDILVRYQRNKPTYSVDVGLLDAVTKVACNVVAPRVKISFSGVNVNDERNE